MVNNEGSSSALEFARAIDAATERGRGRWRLDPETGQVFFVLENDLILCEYISQVDGEVVDPPAIQATMRNVSRLFVPESEAWQILIRHMRSARADVHAIYEAKKNISAFILNDLTKN